jgi:cation-transporting ATPase E
VVPAAVVTAAGGVALYAFHFTFLFGGFSAAEVPDFVVTHFERYTGLSAGDVGFAEAAATVGAHTTLSTFVSYAAFLLILFLKPPNRLFAPWTRPDGDKRPALLVVALAAAFTGGCPSPGSPTTSG